MINKRLKNGFTLVEMAMVLAIIGVIIYGSVKFSAASFEMSNYRTTKTQMAAIKDALQLYYETYGYLPCPAQPDAATNAAAFGVASWTGGVAGVGACNASNILVPTGAYIGVIPNRTLNLPDAYVFDGWGNRITYVVDANGTLSAQWATTTPTIAGAYCPYDSSATTALTIKDNSNSTFASANTITATPIYILISHGKNGIGSWNRSGTRVTTTCPGAGANALSSYEQNNANMSSSCVANGPAASFRDDFINDGTQTGSYFDDIVTWQTDDMMYYIKTCKTSGTSC